MLVKVQGLETIVGILRGKEFTIFHQNFISPNWFGSEGSRPAD